MQNSPMANTYLIVDFKEKDAAKALGARWDGGQRKWYVPDGRELAPFAKWLPAGVESFPVATGGQLGHASTEERGLTIAPKKGMSLSNLLAGVSQAVTQAYKAGVWVLVEVVELRTNGGHVFMGVSERDTSGAMLAKTNAVIWQSTANTILPEFQRATGAQLAPGIKLLVRARPVFKSLHGFTLEVDAIDHEYTLGDLEARKREIRERLQAEGVFASNKLLPAPWDFNAVLVVAPAGGAGLGDFQAEANQLERFGVCRFVYVYSRFQGEGAAREICDALQGALAAWDVPGVDQPDAVVIIRGGGAVNDMAWLNDYDLARLACDMPIPVFTGIGHERDGTVLDEVANTKFDTPSKVIAGIEQTIARRTAEAKAHVGQIMNRSAWAVQSIKASTVSLDAAVRSEAIRHLAMGKQATQTLINGIKLDALREVRSSSELSLEKLQLVKTESLTQLAQAKQQVPMYWGQVSIGVKHQLRSMSTLVDALVGGVLGQARRDIVSARATADDGLAEVASLARHHVREGVTRSEGLIREIAGQGPDKTLGRGFTQVRDSAGRPITRAAQTTTDSDIEIEFSDGRVPATTTGKKF
jgi:exodeoxyribonuclease VII large subunit